jgi:hypothetical protein
MYHWFFLLEITVVKIINYLYVCSTHSYLYPCPRFKEEKKLCTSYFTDLSVFLASDETPYQKPSKPTEDSDDEDSDSDFQIPNETIVITQSPV